MTSQLVQLAGEGKEALVRAKAQVMHQLANKQQLAKSQRKTEVELSSQALRSSIEHRAIIVLWYQLFKSVR